MFLLRKRDQPALEHVAPPEDLLTARHPQPNAHGAGDEFDAQKGNMPGVRLKAPEVRRAPQKLETEPTGDPALLCVAQSSGGAAVTPREQEPVVIRPKERRMREPSQFLH